MLPPIPTKSPPFKLTHTYPHSPPTHSHLLPHIFDQLPLIFSTFWPTPTHVYPSPTRLLPPKCSLYHPFPVNIQVFSPSPNHHLPFQSILSPCVLRAYVFYVPACLCAFVFHVTMFLCNSFLCTLLPMSIYFTCLYSCWYVRTIYLHWVFIQVIHELYTVLI